MEHDLSQIKILVVDNPSEIRDIREKLRDEGFLNVADESSGLKVLTTIKKDPPQAMIVSFILPQYSGAQIYKSVMNDRALASTKFLMVVPKMNRRETADLEKQGIVNWIQRPFASDALRDKIFGLFGMNAGDLKEAAEKLKKEGFALFKKGIFDEAVKKFGESGSIDTCVECSFMLGRCYLELDLDDQAIVAFKEVMKQDFKFPEIDRWLGVAYRKKDDHATSIRHLEKAVKKPEAESGTYVDLGISFLGDGSVEKADGVFEIATGMEPENIDNRTNIGNAYLDKGLYEKAEQAYGAAIDINPTNIPLYNRMAIALRKQGKYKEAIDIYIKALNVAPKDEGLYYNIARALHDSGDKQKAIRALDKAIELDPEFPEAISLRETYMGE